MESSRSSNHIYTPAQTGKITQHQSVHIVLVLHSSLVLRHTMHKHKDDDESGNSAVYSAATWLTGGRLFPVAGTCAPPSPG